MSILILRPNANGRNAIVDSKPNPPAWSCVDDVSPDEYSTYLRNCLGYALSASFLLPNHSSSVGGTINSIKIYYRTFGDETHPHESPYFYIGSSIYWGTEVDQQFSWVTKSQTWTTSPKTSLPWTWEEIDDLEIGVYMDKPECYLHCYITQIYVEIDYEAIPVVSSVATSLIEETTATGNGNITATGDSSVTKRGVCYNTTGNPTVADSIEEDTPGPYSTGAFSKNLTGLTPGQKYYIRAYAYNSEGYGYGSVLTFTTKPNPPTALACAVISSTQINLTWTKGTGAEKTMVRRKIGSYPTSPTDGDEAYYGTLVAYSDDDLARYTHYYYRAWSFKTDAPNSGWSDAYSSDDDSTPAELATILTHDATGILQNQVTGNGEITDTGGVDVTVRGFKYALTKDPLNDVHEEDGTYGIEEYDLIISDLQANTEYWYCAYAVNSIGTAYGEWVKFQTPASSVIPTGTKINICSDNSGYTYELNKSLTDDGESYESYFVLSTDLAQKQGLHFNKRLEDLFSYFEKKDSGTCKIYVKCDNEAEWQYAGEISMTGDEDIIIKHLPSDNEDISGDVDFFAKTYLIKYVFQNDFEFIGLVTEAIPEGER